MAGPDLRRSPTAPAFAAKVTLPPGLTGEFAWRGLTRKLAPGEQSFRLQ